LAFLGQLFAESFARFGLSFGIRRGVANQGGTHCDGAESDQSL
jgi:hypothetical protein